MAAPAFTRPFDVDRQYLVEVIADTRPDLSIDDQEHLVEQLRATISHWMPNEADERVRARPPAEAHFG